MKSDYVILGLGLTGYSCVEYLASQGKSCMVIDDRECPPFLTQLEDNYAQVKVFLPPYDLSVLLQAEAVITSPGLAPTHPLLHYARQHHMPIETDISLFMSAATKPIVAVTGSNGKSTVVKLLHHLCEGYCQTLLGGNYGVPALSLLQQSSPDYYILELSSFQLMYSSHLHFFSSVLLNVSEDHLDWHASFAEYVAAKLRIYENCQHPVVSYDDTVAFADHLPVDNNAYHLSDDGLIIIYRGKNFLPVNALPVLGKANYYNVISALNCAEQMGIPSQHCQQRLHSFQLLPHRCQLVASKAHVAWYNDSKATNVAACIAAIDSMRSRHSGRVILILSGDTKGVDCQPLIDTINSTVSHVILLGDAISSIENALQVSTCQVNSMRDAVLSANDVALAGDAVLFSPAGASFDMFQDYKQRGDAFCNQVMDILCLKEETTTI